MNQENLKFLREDYLHYLPDKQSPLLNPYSRGGLGVYYVSVTD